MNQYAASGTPFFFLIDYHMQNCVVLPLSEMKHHGIQHAFHDRQPPLRLSPNDARLPAKPVARKVYAAAFEQVQKHIRAGNTYLTNLTFSTPLNSTLTLQGIFQSAFAKYKLLWEERFVVFSPETFVQIENGRIATFPMKGTIDASLPNARKRLLHDPKEAAEHATIVDLLRNDLSRVARKVHVKRYRYIERIETHRGALLQSSSHIEGYLPKGYEKKPGDILFHLLPAGSVTGAPKQKTLQIIAETETHSRNYYTGVFGIFSENKLDSAVAIRFIEKNNQQLFFKSGGGITAFSQMEKEYKELIQKVYLPLPAQKNKHKETLPLIESIRIENGRPLLLQWHQKRMQKSCQMLFGRNAPVLLKDIPLPTHAKQGVFKWRLLYGPERYEQHFLPYKPKPVKTLRLVYDDKISYDFKYSYRDNLQKLLEQKGKCDDIAIVKNGFITDASYGNLIFFDGSQWYTPDTPLLPGVQRAYLLKNSKITAIPIRPQDLKHFSQCKLINAMLPFELAPEVKLV